MFEFLSSFFTQSDLCDKKTLNLICDRFPPKLVTHSINSAHALNATLQFVKHGYNDYSYEKFFDHIYKYLEFELSDTMTSPVHLNPYIYDSNYSKSKSNVEKKAFEATIAKFMYYYLTRLAIMLNGISYEGKPFSKREKNIIASRCFEEVGKSKYANNYYIVPNRIRDVRRDYWTAYNIKKEEEKMNYINNYRLFFQGRVGENEILPIIDSLSSNQKKFLFNLKAREFPRLCRRWDESRFLLTLFL